MLPPARLPTIVKTNLFRPRCADMGRPFLKEVSSCPVLASLLCPMARAVRRDALRGRTAACAAQPRDAAQAGETAVAGRVVRQCRSHWACAGVPSRSRRSGCDETARRPARDRAWLWVRVLG